VTRQTTRRRTTSGRTGSAPRRGWAFVSYAHEDEERVDEVVSYLKARGIEVWWDDLLEPGDDWSGMLLDKIRYAACFVVLWSEASVRADFVRAEALRANEALNKGRIVPVLLDRSAVRNIPLPFNALQHVDLSEDGGQRRRELAKLGKRVGGLVRRPPRREEEGPNLSDDYALRYAKQASTHLRRLSARIGSIGQVLVTDDAAVARLRAALNEVDLTLDVVSDAVEDFVAAGLTKDDLDPRPYLGFERGALERRIREGRGHCDLIAVHYGAPDGVRPWLKANAPARVVARADNVFGQLATADGDVFRELALIGEALTNESRVVVNLLVAGQPERARQRVLEGRQRLMPLEDDLRKSTEVLQEVESTLGYARTR